MAARFGHLKIRSMRWSSEDELQHACQCIIYIDLFVFGFVRLVSTATGHDLASECGVRKLETSSPAAI